MDVMTVRFIIIFLIILVGLIIIPFSICGYWIHKYQNKGKWWMLPVLIIYLVVFFAYARDIVPERWSLKPVEVYQCEWKTQYIPKYPVEDK